jgi:8-oxo-dGTP diphosphatase
MRVWLKVAGSWEKFGEMLNGLEISVYALGGMYLKH